MKAIYKHLTSLIAISFLSLLFVFVTQTSAQTSTTVKASVGKYYLSVSGFASPFASIVMTSKGVFMASSVADPKGNFAVVRVLVNEGFTEFCLEVIDVKRIGSSFTCFRIPPVKANTEKRNIFLPPTLGLSGKKIVPGSSVFASGYSMPNAKVFINISEDIIIETTANSSGFYKVEIKDLPGGKYKLFATAKYQNRDSEKPDRKLDLESLSIWDLIRENLLLILLILLLVLIIIILVIIRLSKRLKRRLMFFGKKQQAPLHHSWFIGY